MIFKCEYCGSLCKSTICLHCGAHTILASSSDFLTKEQKTFKKQQEYQTKKQQRLAKEWELKIQKEQRFYRKIFGIIFGWCLISSIILVVFPWWLAFSLFPIIYLVVKTIQFLNVENLKQSRKEYLESKYINWKKSQVKHRA